MPEGPLSGIRVFDLTLAAVGPWSSLNLGALGADVIHVEPAPPPADGDQQRVFARGGVLRDRPMATEKGIQSWAVGYISWNLNKRCITLDLKSPDDRAVAYRLLKTCDVFVNNMRPGVAERLGMGYAQVAQVNDQIVYCTITGWGDSGPMRDIPASDPPVRYLTGFHEGTGAAGGDPEGYRFAGQLDFTSGNFGTQAMLMGLLARKRTGRGQRVNVTMMNSSGALQSVRIGEYLASGRRPQPLGSTGQSTAPDGAFLCADGRYLGVSVTSDRDWHAFCEAIERTELIEDARFRTNPDRVDHRDDLSGILEPIFGALPVDYWELVFERAGIAAGHVIHWSELHHHDQLLANDYLVKMESPRWGSAWTSGPPYHLSKTPQRWFPTPAIGEHNEEVIAELMGSSAPDRPSAHRSADTGLMKGPLDGFRVVDMSEGVAGPYAAMLLGDAGAEVTKIERPEGDRSRQWGSRTRGTVGTAFIHLNRNKQSIVLDVDSDAGAAAARRLIANADVVITDAGWSARADLQPDAVVAANPGLICTNVSLWGDQGPWANRPPHGELAVQMMTDATAGLGRPGDPPVRLGPDVSGMYAAINGVQAICAALLAKDHAGGQRIDISLLGSLMTTRPQVWVSLSDPADWWGFQLDWFMKPPDLGNTCSDGQILFTVPLMPQEKRDQLYVDLDMLWIRDDPLYEIMNEDRAGIHGKFQYLTRPLWNRALSKFTTARLAEIVEPYGCEVFPWNTYEQMLEHPQFKHLGIMQTVSHSELGDVQEVNSPWRFADTPPVAIRPAPRLGEHSEAVLQRIGYSAGEISAL